MTLAKAVSMKYNRGEDGWNRDFSAHKRKKKIGGSHIVLPWNQHTRIKDDIFIFHEGIFQLVNGVELSRKNKNQSRTFYFVFPEIYRNASHPLFDVDQFQFIVPVQRYTRKIQWDRA